jgi:patatin-like phospholipase/acyl hydrolase
MAASANMPAARTTSKIRVLSIDGGGIRGIIPATILQYIEQEIGRLTGNKNARIGEYFDLLAGTSTGGILISLYLTPADKGTTKASFNATQALDLYLQHGNKIFKKGFWDSFTNFKLWNERYRADNLQKLLEAYFGDTLLSQLIRPCVITSYDFFKRRATFFNSADARRYGGEVKDFFVKNITRATSAAPTYFEPARIKSIGGGEFNLIDGGVFVNNPAMCAYSEARNTEFSKDHFMNSGFKLPKPDRPRAKDMFHVSIGTGSETKKIKFEELKDAGLVTWLPVLIDIMMSGSSETVDYHLRKMYDTLEPADKEDYIRLSPSLHAALPDMDNATKKNIDKLHEAGNVFVYDNTKLLNTIAAKLVEYS